jgi:hypothetical protein
MNPDELADRMRQGEVFHSLRMLPGAWKVDSELPMKEEYEAWLRRILEAPAPREA